MGIEIKVVVCLQQESCPFGIKVKCYGNFKIIPEEQKVYTRSPGSKRPDISYYWLFFVVFPASIDIRLKSI